MRDNGLVLGLGNNIDYEFEWSGLDFQSRIDSFGIEFCERKCYEKWSLETLPILPETWQLTTVIRPSRRWRRSVWILRVLPSTKSSSAGTGGA